MRQKCRILAYKKTKYDCLSQNSNGKEIACFMVTFDGGLL